MITKYANGGLTMALDGLSLNAVVRELAVLAGAKIERVAQPDRDSLLLLLHTRTAGRVRLYLNIHSENGRIQLTRDNRESPVVAPAFCMLLRKYLVGGRIESLQQFGLDRRCEFLITSRDEFSDEKRLRLTVELMGKHGNIFLLDENGIILDCLRHIGLSEDALRVCLPNAAYKEPPQQDKLNPFELGVQELADIPEGRLSSVLMGVSRLAANNMPENAHSLQLLLSELGRGVVSPHLIPEKGVLPFRPLRGGLPYPTMSLAMDAFYSELDRIVRMRRLSASMRSVIEHAKKRTVNKLATLNEIMASESVYEGYKLHGELILANAYRIKRGDAVVTVENYYDDPPRLMDIPLDVRCTPNENAQRYFKKYRKSKTARSYAERELSVLSDELLYLEGQLENLDKCESMAELDEIHEELCALRYIKNEQGAKRQRQVKPSVNLEFNAEDGTIIKVGKNNSQNERLTKNAKPEYIWLHIKDAPGSHVIVESEAPAPATLLLAARLAAYYSSQRASGKVAIDYTQKRYVKKPSGARPGFVIYTNARTLFVEPYHRSLEVM